MPIIARKKFHVDHDVRPVHVIAILKHLSPFVGDVRSQLLTDLAAGGHSINPHYLFWNLKVLRILGLTDVDEKTESWRLTRRGVYLRALAEWNQRTFFDIMHYLYYASWDFGDQETATFSWTYQTVCNTLWKRRPTVIDGKSLAAEVRDLAQQEFGLDSVSITDYAIDGVYNWLRALDPAFAWTDSKTRRRETNAGRSNCSAELFLLAVDHLYRTEAVPYNHPLTLGEDNAAKICGICLLDSMKWKGVLGRAAEQFSILHRAGSASGPQVTLERAPRLILWPGDSDTTAVDLSAIEALAEEERPGAPGDDSLDDEDTDDEEEDLEEGE